MIHFSNLTNEAVANISDAMEADTISKNGRSSKSQMSRWKILTRLFVGIISVSFLFACSSPEKDGIKVAKEMCKLQQWAQKQDQNWEQMSDRQRKRTEQIYLERRQKVTELENKFRDKYITNEYKHSDFWVARHNYKCKN